MTMKASFAAQFPSTQSFAEKTAKTVRLTRNGIVPATATTTSKEDAVMTENTRINELTAIIKAQQAQIQALTTAVQQLTAQTQHAPAPAQAPADPETSTYQVLKAEIRNKTIQLTRMIRKGQTNTPEYRRLVSEIEELERLASSNSPASKAANAVEKGVSYLNKQVGKAAATVTDRVEEAAPHLATIATTTAALGLGAARVGLNTVNTVGTVVLDTAESLVDPTMKALTSAVNETNALIRALFGANSR